MDIVLRILLDIVIGYCTISIVLMLIGTFGYIIKPYIFETLRTQLKYKFNYEIKSNFIALLYYYVFCWFMWPSLLINLILNKEDTE